MSSSTTFCALLLSIAPIGFGSHAASAQHVPLLELYDGAQIASVVHDEDRPLTLAAAMLSKDLRAVTGRASLQSHVLDDCANLCVVVAKHGSPLAQAVVRDTGIDVLPIELQWERYVRAGLPSRSKPQRRYLVIIGSDVRGAIWGTVDLTREMGVSAWEWWADVSPRRVDRVVVDGAYRVSKSPSIKYRGIFLNDEDWGLQPWAAQTYERDIGDIGPKTYARIFELMWRLKANLLWPAMHESTKPFYQIAGNAETARDHAIVVGTSHAEPMMRNNVREWDEAKFGPFNFFTNKDALTRYWRTRAREVRQFESIYTVGLRGKHDSAMEGASSPEMARDALEDVIKLQRELLSRTQSRAVTEIPQVLTLYKEMRDLYALGLDVPEDVTLVWPEDNYGYIHQLSTPQERARSGGAGVYYHISYWGRPHDYLWLATTHPALIREQMQRAWHTGAQRIWVLNVGDIKPSEYLTEYFLDLAFDADRLRLSAHEHLVTWASAQFGAEHAPKIATILREYYALAFERRPEFMGFSQVEPTRPITISDYVRSGGAEARQRIDAYAALRVAAEELAPKIAADRIDAFFQLVLYPVRAAASINERNLKLDLAALYGRQGRPVANVLSLQARAAHSRIVEDTRQYNTMNGGKWRHMMSAAPRDLPVFAEPAYPSATFAVRPGCAIDASELWFVQSRAANHSLTIHSWGEPADWAISEVEGLRTSAAQGRLHEANGFEQRVTFEYDGIAVAPRAGTLSCGGTTYKIPVQWLPSTSADMPVEIQKSIVMSVPIDNKLTNDWELIDGLGSQGTALRSKLALSSRSAAGDAALIYEFETATVGGATLHVVALPVHPLTSENGLRIAIELDERSADILDFQTHGRSDEWKRNVLSNSARRTIQLPQLPAGKHRLRIYALDPGFVLDRLELRLDGAPDRYGAAPTR
jgi:hypothetical protein